MGEKLLRELFWVTEAVLFPRLLAAVYRRSRVEEYENGKWGNLGWSGLGGLPPHITEAL